MRDRWRWADRYSLPACRLFVRGRRARGPDSGRQVVSASMSNAAAWFNMDSRARAGAHAIDAADRTCILTAALPWTFDSTAAQRGAWRGAV